MQVSSPTTRYRLEERPFARGGEGCVHGVQQHPELVAKIYHPKGRTAQREQKILAMLRNPPKSSASGQTAWPCDIVYEHKTGAFLGFVMPRIKNVSKIDELYSYDSRNDHNWNWYLQVARNLCAAVQSVHDSGHVIGDLNPANICVDPKTALVTLVDTDSYSIADGSGGEYRCGVCRLEYIPAELHRLMDSGRSLSEIKGTTFTRHTDYFALAVHIFALLMNGSHPYACTVSSDALAEQYGLHKNIVRGYFPFHGAVAGVGTTRYAPQLTALPNDLRNLSIQAFSGGKPAKRPTPRQWYDALGRLGQDLRQCPARQAHQFRSGLGSCPLCAAEAEMVGLLARQSAATALPVRGKATSAAPAGGTATGGTATGGTATGGTATGGGRGFHFPDLSGLGSFLGAVLLHLLAAALWGGCMLLAYWLMLVKAPFTAWWWRLICYASLGVVPFVPLVLFTFLEDIFYMSDLVEDLSEIYLAHTGWFTYAVYIGGAAYAGYRSGSLINTVFWVVLICLPLNFVMKIFA